MTLTVGSLFSGIGGIDLGLERAGMQIKWQVEIDPFCQQVLEKHWPSVQRFSNIKDIQELPYVDIVCGGFPCQPVSLCGNRKGEKDERWLWPEFYRIICMVKPEWVLVENVPGLLSIQSGKLFGGILRDLAKIGYDVEWQVLSAAQFGAPHLRKRIFIVGWNPNAMRRFGFERTKQTISDQDTHANRIGNTNIKNFWTAEPSMDRMVNGVPRRLDRLRSLGNAVVPQVIEYIGKCIIEYERLENVI